MRKGILLGICLIAGCGGRYVGWEQVRIEQEVPSPSCKRLVQESCSKAGADCYTWYKQRATVHGANTVVVTQSSQGQQSSSGGGWNSYGGWTGGSSQAVLTMLADYYQCPAP